MSLFAKNPDSTLDQAVAEITAEPIDPAMVEQAAARVWQRLSEGAPAMTTSATSATSAATEQPAVAVGAGSLRGCDDFQRLIPAYLAGELPPARALLVEDHTRSCISCRRALKTARTGEASAREVAVAAPAPSALRNRRLWLALAAVLTLGVGLGLFLLAGDLVVGGSQMASIQSVEGDLFLISGESIRPLGAGDRVREGDEVRTAKTSRAVLRLPDGSRVEVSERSGLSYDVRRSGTTVDLAQGRVIVEAAKQRDGHLFVATEDCLVSVTGTIFAVNHGTKGSRVSVVEGEVRVKQSRRDDILHPGGQVTTHASVEAVPVRDEISWSSNAAQYEALLAELTALGRAIDAQVGRPGVRTSTRLLDLAPAGTMVWVGLPNLAQNLRETQRLLDQRLEENVLLRQWWSETLGSGERSQEFHDAIERLGELGRSLGEEVAVAVTPDGPVVLAEVTDAGAFRSQLEAEAARLAGHGGDAIVLVDDPADIGGVPADGFYLWVRDDVFVATPTRDLLGRMAAVLANPQANPFLATSFHDKVATAYADGAGWLFSGDLKALIRHEEPETSEDASEDSRIAESLGILDLDHFLIDRREGEDGSRTIAAVTFDQPRRGLASWLAAPAPMRTLEFVSPDANLAAAFVVKDPVNMLDDLITALPGFGEEVGKLAAEHGLDLREIASALGGEVAFAVDGPLLPEPSWKLVVEVYDPERLQHAFAALVARLNDELREEGKPPARLTSHTAGGRTYHALITGQGPEVHFTLADGYLVAAPSQALLDRTLQQRDSGVTLATSARFQELLPEDKQINFSALIWHDLGSVLAPVGRTLESAGKNLRGPQGQDFAKALAGSGPALTYAYGQEDRILFANNSKYGPLGFNLGALAGFGGLAGMMDEIETHAEEAQEEAR